jgi:hypothetical protein
MWLFGGFSNIAFPHDPTFRPGFATAELLTASLSKSQIKNNSVYLQFSV